MKDNLAHLTAFTVGLYEGKQLKAVPYLLVLKDVNADRKANDIAIFKIARRIVAIDRMENRKIALDLGIHGLFILTKAHLRDEQEEKKNNLTVVYHNSWGRQMVVL